MQRVKNPYFLTETIVDILSRTRNLISQQREMLVAESGKQKVNIPVLASKLIHVQVLLRQRP